MAIQWTALVIGLTLGLHPIIASNISYVGHEVIVGNNKFTMDLYKTMSGTEGNLFFSPFSVSTCLAILYLMSNGETADEVARALHVPSKFAVIGQGFHDILQPINRGPISWADKIFIEEGFRMNPRYISTIEAYLNAEIGIESFAREPKRAHDHIQQWISEKTHGRITELSENGDITENTKMILVSTMYFQGKWHHSIRPDSSRMMPFYYGPGQSRIIEMMTLRGSFGHCSLPAMRIRVLLIPYKDFKQNMIIMLPDNGGDLPLVGEELTQLDFIQDIIRHVHYTTLEVILPKFKLERSYELKENLRQLGIHKVFEAGKSDFSNAVETPGLEVSSIQHKTFVEISEQGTFASAATGAVLTERADVHEVPVFLADRPFLFAITDGETKAILFFGRYSSPNYNN